jgi:Tfp pilus assembly protein PilN
VTRINLLPPEILEKRKAESRLYVFIALGMVVLFIIGVAFAALSFGQNSASQELVQVKQETQNLKSQAEQFRIFEEKQAELSGRKQLVDQALAGRDDWARLLSEVGLILPSDTWLENLDADQTTGLTLSGRALDGLDAPDNGHKSIAKMLVRLADLGQLKNVWLTGSTKEIYLDQPSLKFDLTADVTGEAAMSASTTATGQ